MSLLKRISDRLHRDYYRHQYQRAAVHVTSTAPVVRGTVPYTLLSMVHTRDVISYLVAVKSFAACINPERIVVVCDPTISQADKILLTRHIPHIELRHADEFVDTLIPRGGCWERLFAISALSPESYVVQLDADTVTVAAIPEVADAIMAGKGFVLGEVPEQKLLTLEQSAANARLKIGPNPHVQTLAESSLIELGLPLSNLYVRGCAGFTGFPRSAEMRSALLDFSQRMTHKLGIERWSAWGTEQVTSNYLVANSPGTEVLPFPKYGTPDMLSDQSAFLHFIGSMRFVDHKYEQITGQTIAGLNQVSSGHA